ncbi:MAG: acyl carrier protein [Planctomycetota bacterium]|jgi:acyl carrier protein
MATPVDTEAVQRQVIDTIVEEMTIERANVKLDSRLVEDLGAGSLHLIEIAFSLEEKFGVELPPESEKLIKTVGDIVKLVGDALPQK